MTKSSSESRSEKPSKVGKPCVALNSKRLESGALVASTDNMKECSSSSPEQRIGRVGKSTEREIDDLAEPTVRFRGSQNSTSCSEVTERGYGDGDGERDGQAVAARSSLGWTVDISEGGLMNTES